MNYIQLNSTWESGCDIEKIHTTKETPELMRLTLPDMVFAKQTGLYRLEDIAKERCLKLEICFN